MSLKCNVIDVGARYGLHPSWNGLRGLMNFYLFEMDEEEAERLQKKYEPHPNIRVYPTALYSKNCTLKYKVRKHKGLNSFLDSNVTFLKKKKYFAEESIEESEVETEATTIDSFFEGQSIHFLKVDTEGADLEVLQGAKQKLENTILGARTEVYFVEFNSRAPLFGDMHKFMISHNFDLINLDYAGQGHHFSKFTRPGKYGQLMGTDAVWIKSPDLVLDQPEEKLIEDVVFLAIFLMHNNATDIAMNLLLRAMTERHVSFYHLVGDPIFESLKRDISFLFKDMLLMPGIDENEIYDVYFRLFQTKYPKWNSFYETYSL